MGYYGYSDWGWGMMGGIRRYRLFGGTRRPRFARPLALETN